MYVCVYVCACAHACVRSCVGVCVRVRERERNRERKRELKSENERKEAVSCLPPFTVKFPPNLSTMSLCCLMVADCGVQMHKKCSEKVPNDCMPNMKYVKRLYGVDLTTVTKANKQSLPVVVEKCVKEIEKRGINTDGKKCVKQMEERYWG